MFKRLFNILCGVNGALLMVFLLSIIIKPLYCFNIDENNAFILVGETDSYFGFSVEILKNKWVLVGAPTSNDTNMPSVYQPGVVHRCAVPVNGQCEQINIDDTLGEDSAYIDISRRTFFHGRDGQWLGGRIEVPNNDALNKAIVVCAHRWHNDYFLSSHVSYMNGLCYLIPQDFTTSSIKKLPIMVSKGEQAAHVSDMKTIYKWGMAGYGMDVHYTEQNDHILFGAPGLLDWSGGLIDMGANKPVKVMDGDVNRVVDETSGMLAGYAVSSGRYFNASRTHFAMGIPRADLVGEIRFYGEGDAAYQLENYVLSIKGRDTNGQELPINTYFGGSLCTADVNNDGLDDLLVGAPMFSRESSVIQGYDSDVGRVFLYMGNANLTRFAVPSEILTGNNITNSRFGTSISPVGDLNSDGFQDIAIGSPYEEDMKGAVYIYNGYKDGLWPAFSQRVAASSLEPSLRGFGISISKGNDINSDNINDIVVGSYLSDNAVVLYGQPVISISANLVTFDTRTQLSIQHIEQNASFAGVKVCFKYSYRFCTRIDLNITLSLDAERPNRERLVFQENNLPRMVARETIFSGDSIEDGCYTNNKLAVKSTNDLVSPISIVAEYAIENMCPGTTVNAAVERFNGNNPGDPDLKLEQKVEFTKDCPDNKCESDLRVNSVPEFENVNGYFVIGSSKLVIDINITKTGDPSYGSVFYVAFPSYLGYSKMQQISGEDAVSCSFYTGVELNATSSIDKEEETNTAPNTAPEALQGLTTGKINITDDKSVLVCNFGNPMRNDSGIHVHVHMTMPIHVTKDKMAVEVLATTQSKELQPNDNMQTLEINMRHHVSLTLSGVSPLEEVFLRESKDTYSFEHRYELANQGPSSLPKAEIAVYFPQIQTGSPILWLNKTKVKCAYPCQAQCHIEGYTNSPRARVIDFNGKEENLTVYHDSQSTISDLKHLDCTKEPCSQFKCSVTRITPDNSAVLYIQFEARKGIEDLIQNRKPLSIISRAESTIDDTTVIVDNTRYMTKLVTRIMPRPQTKKEVEWWVILLSILGGILFIAILILILFKIGFFKRKTRDELEQLMKADKKEPNTNGKSDDRKDSYTDSDADIIDQEQPPEKKAAPTNTSV